jgi:hypothetical protein
VKSRSNRAVKGGFKTQVFDGKKLKRHFHHEAIEGNEDKKLKSRKQP